MKLSICLIRDFEISSGKLNDWNWSGMQDRGRRKWEKIVGPQQCGYRTGSRERNHLRGLCVMEYWKGMFASWFEMASHAVLKYPSVVPSPLSTPHPIPESFHEGQREVSDLEHPNLLSEVEVGSVFGGKSTQRRLELLRGVVLGRAKCDPGVKVGSKRWQKATYSVSICPLPRVLSYTGERTEILYPMHDRVSNLFIGTFR